jgi:hypothetical protein
MSDQEKLKEYDLEPVVFCTRCYSLRIVYEPAIDADCCGDCGCSDTAETTIENWEKLYEKRYGHKYVTRNSDPQKTMVYNMSIEELKENFYDQPSWKDIIISLYPTFPGGIGKLDSIILFFDKLIKDGRLDELRQILVKKLKEK